MEQKINNQIEKNPFYKKVWYSITKFEKYPNMAAEGVGRTIGYLCLLMFIFSVFMAIALLIKLNGVTKQGIDFLDKSFTEINYKNGILSVKPEKNSKSSLGNVIINTGELTPEQKTQYENTTSNNLEFIWLNDKVIAKFSSNSMTYYYKDILGGMGIEEFNKTVLITFMRNLINRPQLYIIYGIIITIYTFLAYLLSTLIDILILSIFGMITTWIAGLKVRYRAIFNMSVYAITLSTFLRLIYLYIEMFTDFNIKYFDLMYNAISFICLTAAIFMIKSDLIKQQIEIMKTIQIKKQEQEEQQPVEDKKEDKKEDKEQDKEDKKENEKEKEEEGKIDGNTQGSNA